MIKTITDIQEYLPNPKLETMTESYNHHVSLFNRDWLMIDDYWMKHIHIKVTDICNAKCPFCIEKGSSIKTNWAKIFSNVSLLLDQMSKQGDLCTVSITGGEPSLYKKETGILIDIIKQYDCFVTMNTNFTNFPDSIHDLDYIDISRHCIGNDDICGIPVLDQIKLRDYKKQHPNTKIRIQCVLHNNGLKSINDFITFVKYYSQLADDISIRRLITTSNDINENDLYSQIKKFCFDNGKFKEQTLKDYYVYEIWNLFGIDINFSHSNMKLLKVIECNEPDNLLREIVVHPDGLISGSWYRDKKIIIN